jgi:carbamoyltransferase
MKVLGIGDHISCGSAIIEDGKVVAAINDERLVREKMVFGVPRQSIRMNLDMLGLGPEDIDAIAVGTKNQHIIDGYVDFRDGWFGLKRGNFKQTLFEVGSHVSKFRATIPFLDDAYYLTRRPAFRNRQNQLRRILREEFGFTCPVHFLDHHFCHAASAYYTSGFRCATVFSIDGGGDGNSGKVYDVVDGRFQELTAISSFDSLGAFYSYVTQICGFKAGRHEGKITGLAAYGEPIYVPELQQILQYQDGGIKNVANVFFLSALEELRRVLPADFQHRDLAASAQVHAEEIVVNLVEYWLNKTGHYDVAVAGGVMSNVKINQRIHEIADVERIYVHPGMADDGMPVGAGLGLYYQISGTPYDPERETMDHVYLGPEYDDNDIQRELEKQEIAATYCEDIEPEIARLLADGAVVARFDGRMEYGPRALGNRSILYQATDATVNTWLNAALKRTEFMPFAPIVNEEHASHCFLNMQGAENTARFMTITFMCTPWMVENCPGVVHVDYTARPQIVRQQDNPSVHKILSEYYDLTGIRCLINTSFNMHEEPIVCSPYDAVRSFMTGALDYLAIGNWLAKNPNPAERQVDPTRIQAFIERTGVIA